MIEVTAAVTSFAPGLKVGQTLNNNELMETFKCSPQGGMRRSLRTNSLVLISDHVDPMYHDRWINDVFHYTGMGLIGDQSIEATQNRTLAESDRNGVSVFLFEKHRNKEYTFSGPVELAGEPYQEDQPDSEGNLRKVWVFPLKSISDTPAVIPARILHERQEKEARKAKRLNDQELRSRALNARNLAGTRNTLAKSYERNAYVSEYAKRRANGYCQLCECPAPFTDSHGNPYLETHHIVWLSNGGNDSIENTVALCPNCHRKMHVLNRQADVQKLVEIANKITET